MPNAFQDSGIEKALENTYLINNENLIPTLEA